MAKVALLIGVSEYEPGLNSLPAAVKDISALGKVLKDPELGNFDSVEILPNPDRQTMESAIETLLENRTKEDLVVLFFSGHGIKDHDYNKLHFATRITRKNNQGRLIVSSAVAARFVHDLINSPSNRQLKRLVIILDCCFSGAFDPALSAKDGGSIDLQAELGAEGRIVLTASDSTQYAFEQKGADLSIYTRYLVQGIETGLGDLDEDGWVSVSELHDYAARQVQQAAPLMTPQLITLRGNITKNFDIKLAKAKLTDPKLKFHKKVTEYAPDGQILPAAKWTLEAYRKQFGLTAEEKNEIIADVLRPFQEYQDNLQQYREAFRDSCEHQYPLIESELVSLRDLQRILALRDGDIEPIQQEIEALFANKNLKEVHHREYEQKLGEYEQALREAVTAGEIQYPLSPSIEADLQEYRQDLKLKESDITAIENKILLPLKIQYEKSLEPEEDLLENDIEDEEFLELEEDLFEQYEESFNHQILTETLPGGITLTLPGGIILEMIKIPAGSFLMGSAGWFNNSHEDPQHQVNLQEFYLGKYPVTQEQYQAIMGTNPSEFKDNPKNPVENAQWYLAYTFCQKLSEKTGKKYRLPSEAEWEYACRAGTQTRYYFGDNEKQLGEYAWFDKNSNSKTHPVGQKKPNNWGLYDMSGNVWEWCKDPYRDSYVNKPENIKNNGNTAWSSSNISPRVLRGGSWCSNSGNCRSAYRSRSNADARISYYGFRLVLCSF